MACTCQQQRNFGMHVPTTRMTWPHLGQHFKSCANLGGSQKAIARNGRARGPAAGRPKPGNL
eukprot:8954839-Lingulodinium_polyedra.AAC.1